MKKYYIDSNHEIFIDSYLKGELGHVNFFEIKEFIKANNAKEALQKFLDNVLFYSIDIDEIDLDEGFFQFSILVDNENSQASINQIEMWKNEKLELYSDLVTLKIYELNQINVI